MKSAEIRSAIADICAAFHARLDWQDNAGTIHSKDDEHTECIARAIQALECITAGRAGHEYMRELGLIQHVYAFRMGAIRLRVVSPAFHPRGQFSNLRALERRVAA